MEIFKYAQCDTCKERVLISDDEPIDISTEGLFWNCFCCEEQEICDNCAKICDVCHRSVCSNCLNEYESCHTCESRKEDESD